MQTRASGVYRPYTAGYPSKYTTGYPSGNTTHNSTGPSVNKTGSIGPCGSCASNKTTRKTAGKSNMESGTKSGSRSSQGTGHCIGDDPGPDPDTTLEDQAEKLTAGSATFHSVVVPPNASSELDWSQMTIEFTGNANGGDYSTTNSANTTVWPEDGTWSFGDDDTGKTITRNDGVIVNISPGTTQLVTVFDIDTSSGRVKVVDGEWTFTFNFD